VRREGERLRPSLAGRLVLLFIIFIAVPMVLYVQFQDADEDKRALLLGNVEERGRLVAEMLRLELDKTGLNGVEDLAQRLERMAGPDTNYKLLFRPNDAGDPAQFFYLASAPAISARQLESEREHLQAIGVLDELAESCAGARPVASRRTTELGTEEVLTSVTPIHTGEGCWVLVTAHSTASYRESSIGQPYWMTPEVRFAAAIYLAMAVITLTILYGIWRSLNSFARHAREVRAHGLKRGTFFSKNKLREFDEVAEELDRLVVTLEQSSQAIRQAAEENAHAFKTPIAVISQSVEPLRRLVAPENERGQRALGLIEQSIERLDVLIACARRMDEMVADLIDPPRHEINLSVLLERVLDGCTGMFAGRNLLLRQEIDEDVVVRAGEELLETVIENLVENAVHFSSPRGVVSVRLKRSDSHAALTIEDNGPGVPEEDLEKIFDRYFSKRPAAEARDGGVETRHFGIGLWIVRRNVQAIGGAVAAENRPEGGLRMGVLLPLAEKS
jgi:two-component system sensor histidine kinase ChvG